MPYSSRALVHLSLTDTVARRQIGPLQSELRIVKPWILTLAKPVVQLGLDLK
jgi:hypothetical protein